jgi:hypothetical protein
MPARSRPLTAIELQGKSGRPAILKEVHQLIRDMWQANPTWGAPRMVGELRRVGLEVIQSTVEKHWMRPHRPPSPTWKTFRTSHVQDLMVLVCCVMPTVTHKVFFVLPNLAHHRWRVVYVAVTKHLTAAWTAQQVGDAHAGAVSPRHLLTDRDCIYDAGADVLDATELRSK